MRRIRQFSLLVLVLQLLLGLGATVYAHDVPDLTRKGSITVSFDLPEDWPDYGTLTLIRVGEICEDNGSYFFRPVAALEAGGFSLEDIHSPDLAQQLADFIRVNPLEGITEKIAMNEDKTVTVTFSDLELGLYLALQNKAATAYQKVPPFLISTPYVVDGVYVYDVDAKSKSQLEQEPTTAPTTAPTDPTIPQTGQYNWPVPVMAVLGVSFFAIGWILRTGRKERNAK